MKSRHFTAIALSILSLCVLPSCDKSVAVTGIKLDKTSLSLTEGESANLTATIEPSNATNGTVTWSSTDATIASVNNGLVKALTAGSTTVKVTTADGAKTAECAVTVNKKVIAVTGVSLDAASATLVVGQTKQLTATVKPDDASDKNVTWSSSNAAIASVDANGKVTAAKAGTATITVVTNGTNASGKTEMATCDITVTQPVSGVTLDKTSLTITEGEAATLTATVKPDDASDKTITWSSSDAAIAAVENGKVTAVKEGSAKITVTTKDGGKTAECAVTVNKKVIAVTGVSLDAASATLVVGQTKQLTATVKPDDASDKSVTWSSSNAAIASVDANGKVTAVKTGTATITVVTNGTNASGKTEMATCDVTVTHPVSGVSLDKTTLTLTEGEAATLTATVSPDDASDKTVTWSSSDAKVATVENGKVTAIAAGSAKITVTTTDGAKTAECAVTVSKKIIAVAGVSLDKTTADMIVGQTQQLTATVTPDDASDKSVTWSSSNDNIASVDATGKVTAVAGGAATITAKTNGLDESGQSKMATCDVTVTQPVSGVSLDKTTLTLTEGETATLTATVSPDDASDKTVTWSSSDAKVATVENGKVTAIAAGSAKITVTTSDGAKTAECAVTVNKNSVVVTGISLDKTSANLIVGQTEQLLATVKPDDATDKSVTWMSSDEEVASVSATGTVTALKAGDAIIFAMTNGANASGKSEMATCDVTVTQPVTGITLDKATAAILVGQTEQLTATVSPDDASDKSVTWSSSDEKIASVDATGKVSAVKAGSATITAVTTGLDESGQSKMATCDVTVLQPVTGITLDKATAAILVGQTEQLTATVSPDDASDKTVTWSSSDAKVATVDNGKVTAVKEGSAKITVTTTDGGKTAECAVTVSKKIIPVAGVTLDKTTANMVEGQTLQLTATVKPDDATDKTVSWSSSNASVAGVDADGLVSAKTVGSATITVTTTDGGKMATCDVTVKEMNIDIPDANFKAYLVQNFDTDGDGEISLSEAAAVTDINCNNMSIASLEGIQYFTALTVLECSYNQLTSLDVSKNTALTELHCVSNQLKSLDLSKNTALTVLECSFNQLTSLDVNKNTALTVLHCFRNKLTVLDVSNNTALAVLQCHINKLTVLDMSNNTALQSAFVGRQTDASGNLQWISVKKGSLADSVFPYLGDSSHGNYMVSFVINIDIPDANFKAYLVQKFDADKDGEISLSEAAAVTEIYCGDKSISSLAGIQYFTALTVLYCYANQLTSLDVSNNTALVTLSCHQNKLTSLNISANTALTSLSCYGNQLSSLDASTMAGSSFELGCGRQTDALGADKVLALVLSTSQKTRWETLMADSFGAYFNANVSVTYK